MLFGYRTDEAGVLVPTRQVVAVALSWLVAPRLSPGKHGNAVSKKSDQASSLNEVKESTGSTASPWEMCTCLRNRVGVGCGARIEEAERVGYQDVKIANANIFGSGFFLLNIMVLSMSPLSSLSCVVRC